MQVSIDFDPPSNGTATSDAAASSIRPHAETLRAFVYQFVRSRGDYGATRHEIEAAIGLAGNTVRPRVCELMNSHKLVETDLTRITPSGRKAAVLVAVA